MEGFMFRFHPQHQKVKDLIKEGKIGEVKSFNGIFGFPAFPPARLLSVAVNHTMLTPHSLQVTLQIQQCATQ